MDFYGHGTIVSPALLVIPDSQWTLVGLQGKRSNPVTGTFIKDGGITEAIDMGSTSEGWITENSEPRIVIGPSSAAAKL